MDEVEYTSKAAWMSPCWVTLEKLHPRGPTRPPLFPTGHPEPTEAEIGHGLSDIMIRVKKPCSCSDVCREGPPGPEIRNLFLRRCTAMRKEQKERECNVMRDEEVKQQNLNVQHIV